MAGGHAVDADQLQQAARVLNEVPKQALEQPLQAVEQSQIVAADFFVVPTATALCLSWCSSPTIGARLAVRRVNHSGSYDAVIAPGQAGAGWWPE